MPSPIPVDQGAGDALLGIENSLLGRRWVARAVDEARVAEISRTFDVSDSIARALVARGIASSDVETFLSPTLKALMPDPSTLAGMDQAAARIVRAIENKERIAIFGDYDVDGATSSAVLVRFFRSIGVEAVTYIPDRLKEGYGPNAPALLGLREQGADLLITVDCGITAFEPLEAAANAGLDVVVVDHHKAEPGLPPAAAVVNPNRLDDTSGQGHLAAVGVSFLLAVAVNRALRQSGWYGRAGIREPDLRLLLDLVALGTVCDVVPLKGLNRAFVNQGLGVMARGANTGLKALARAARLEKQPEAFHLGFLLGPRVNAGGRVGEAALGTRLLTTEDADEAAALALRLEEYNANRKEIEAAVLMEAMEQVEGRGNTDVPVIFASGKDWHPGVIGIVASRLRERYDRPVCVIARDGGMAKGSGRSMPGIDLGRAVLAARDAGLLFNGGGHAMAAGFTVEEGRLDAFCNFLSEAVRGQVEGGGFQAIAELDGAITVEAATADFVMELARLEPFGAGNEEPRFAVLGGRVVRADVVGQGHVRCMLEGSGGGRLKAIAFNSADSDLGFALLSGQGRALHLAGALRLDTWQGRNQAQLQVEDAAWAE